MIHLVGMVCFAITFVCNDGYNRSIGTPIPIPSPYSVTSVLRRCGCVRDADAEDGDDDGSAAYEWGAVAMSPRSRDSSPVVYARRLSDPTTGTEHQPLMPHTSAGAVNVGATAGAASYRRPTPNATHGAGYTSLPRAAGSPNVVGFVSMA